MGATPKGTPGLVLLAALSLLSAKLAEGNRACPEVTGAAVPFRTIARGFSSGIERPERQVVRTQEAWEALWQRHTSTMEPRPNLPSVSFSEEMVIAVFRGKTQGPFPVEIRKAIRGVDELVVQFTEVSPPPGIPLGVGVASRPFHIIRLKRVPGEVRFEKLLPQELGGEDQPCQ